MSTSSILKAYFRRLGIPDLRVHTSKHFLSVRIPPNKSNNHCAPLVYPNEFPLELRKAMLREIYGPKADEPPFRPGNAGNISHYSMAASVAEFEKVLGITLAPR